MWFLECPKPPDSEHPFEVNELTGRKHCRNVLYACFYANFPLMSEKSSMKRFLLVRLQVLGLCFNRLTGDHVYSRLSREVSPKLVRTQLCQKPKTFSAIFIAFFKSTSNFEHFEKEDELHSLNISEVIDTKECGFLSTGKLLLQKTLLNSTS